MSEVIECQIEAGVCQLILNRPDRLNTFDPQIATQWRHTVEQVSRAADIRVVVITGAGRAFCAGADIQRLSQLQRAGDVDSFRSQLVEGKRLFLLLRSMPQIVVAAVNGVAAGGGCSLVLAADWRIAADSAQLIQAFIRIGMHPDWGAYWSLPALVGRSKALQLMLTGKVVTAEEALKMGLVDEVTASSELMQAAQRFAREIVSQPRLAVRSIKEGLNLGKMDLERLERVLDFEIERQVECFLSSDSREGVRAFLEKRPPRWAD
jgi:2-(1,2-epoxy-1,2-dihydrophenyl)acetyl-CoA isomerase